MQRIVVKTEVFIYNYKNFSTLFVSQSFGLDGANGLSPRADKDGNAPLRTVESAVELVKKICGDGVERPFTIAIADELIRKNAKPRELIKMFTAKNLICWGGSTVCSNVGSLLTVKLLAIVDISIYTPVWSALGVIISLTASIIFREKLGIFSYLAAAVACVAVII